MTKNQVESLTEALIAARPHVQEMSMRLPEASAADCAETLNQIDAALANQEAWVAALLNSPNPDATPAVGGEALRETISNAIMRIVSNRDDLGHTHFIEIRDSIFDALAAQPASPSLAGCLRPGNKPESCQYEGKCLSMACNHTGKTWFGPRMTLEAQDPNILYPKVGHELCSSCGRLFKFGDTCPRGGCPCGGDV